MTEKIHTIPIHDAYAQSATCPLCSLEQTLTEDLLADCLGPSLMEPDVRIVTNERGFCKSHWQDLYNSRANRLGLGLILHTHLCDLADDLRQSAPRPVTAAAKGLFASKPKDPRDKLIEYAAHIERRTASCAICVRLEQTMAHYVDVICHEYAHDPAFRARFDASQGHCLPHFARLLRGAAQHLNPEQASEFVRSLTRQQQASLDTLRDDVDWFTQKFDYRNAKADWKNSKDALPRAIRKIAGQTELQ
jgi:hypothetical protein